MYDGQHKIYIVRTVCIYMRLKQHDRFVLTGLCWLHERSEFPPAPPASFSSCICYEAPAGPNTADSVTEGPPLFHVFRVLCFSCIGCIIRLVYILVCRPHVVSMSLRDRVKSPLSALRLVLDDQTLRSHQSEVQIERSVLDALVEPCRDTDGVSRAACSG